MKRLLQAAPCCPTALLLLLSNLPARGQNSDPASEIAALKQAAAAAQSAGDNAWMLASSALVLLMTGPGLALFYSSLVRKRNVLGTMMQSFVMMAAVSLLWFVCGYSLAFAEGNPFIGDLRYAFLRGVGAAPNAHYAATIPHQTFMIYQLMFAIITPALIAGAFADRVRFGAMLVFSLLWTTIVYFPAAHMVWGKGGYFNAFLGGVIPVFDFAGRTVVHITSGISALVCAFYIGRRHGYPHEPMPPHSLVLSFIGACLLWQGWFGFNAGSALGASALASSAFVTTHMASAAGACSWMLAERFRNGKSSALGAISGSVAGLATVTQGAGFVEPWAGVIIGLLAGVICFWMVTEAKRRFGYDDSLDAFGVHGIGGLVGCTLTGVFATRVVNGALNRPMGLIDGNAAQIGNQLIGAAAGVVLAVVGTIVCLKITELITPLRLTPQEQFEGMDVILHGEEGYNPES